MQIPSTASARSLGRFLLIVMFFAGCEQTPVPVATGPFQVMGTLTLMIGDAAAPSARIELPDVDVTLNSVGSGYVSKTKTQLDGKFYLEADKPGTYTLCWDAKGISTTCGAKITVTNQDLFLRVVTVRQQSSVIYGKVLTADSRACWVNDPFFKLDVSTHVSLLDSAQQVVPPGVRANVEGEYAIGAPQARKRYTVRADCEKANNQASVVIGSSATLANITLPNRAPRIVAITATSAGKGITRAAPGATVRVTAITRDPDLDNVEYLWRTVEGNGSVVANNTPQQNWTLATNAGLHTLYLIARDGKGGYAYKRFDLPVGGTNVGFSGRVIDETSLAPVAGADVTVNSVATKTNAQGWFSVSVPPAPDPERYVLNIQKRQYALLSRIHDKAAAGNTYELIRAQATNHDPNQPIDVVDTRSSGPCGGLGGKGEHSVASQQPTGANTAGRTSYPIDTIPCAHHGAHIVVPASALVDAAQHPAQGPVELTFATLNPSRRSLPGDYRAVNASNAPVEMLSFGALFAEFRDVNGNPVNLKSGTTAEIRIPVSAQQQPSAKPTIAIWSYDEKAGLWREEGQAHLANTPQGVMYVGQTKHFSTLNMDVAGNDPAQATCVRFELGSSLTGWTNLVVRAYVSYAGTSVQVKETALDGAQYHAIYRIPFAPPAPPPNSLRLELRGTYNGQTVVLLNNVINTDARPKMTGTNLWPPYPYAECGVPITLEADPVNLPYYGDFDATGRPAFLSGPTGAFNPPNGDQSATDYYQTIDPANTNSTLSAWWTNHGFNGTDGSGGTSAAYLNFNDLGFGRDMNCKVNGSDLACYVTNYGAPDQNPANADFAQAKDPTKRLATVAMEFKASEPADRQVRFYVYNGGNPAAAGKLKFADLDGLGPKPVPHLCTVCHGGRYSGSNKNALFSRFREFDLQSFKYSGGRSWDYAPTANTLSNAELSAFSALNKMIHDVAPTTSPIKDLVENWYPGVLGAANTAPVKPNVPPGWSTEVNGYHNVYGKSCRTCHAARDNGQPNSFITFSASSSFSGTDLVVCGLPKLMPNAYVTYKNFWSDLQRVIDYRTLTGQTPATCQ